MKSRVANEMDHRRAAALSGIEVEIGEGARLEGAAAPPAERLQRITEALTLYTAPEAETAAADRLLNRIAREKTVFLHSPAHLARVILVQARLFPLSFWLGVHALILAGMLLANYLELKSDQAYLIVAVIPWVGSLGTLFGLRQSTGVWGELEALAPVPPSLLALGRTLACIAIDTLAALLATALVFALGWELSLWNFTLSWLIPLLLSAGLALLLALRFGTGWAIAATVLLWGGQTIYQNELGPFAFLSLPGDPHWAASKGVGLLLASACLGLAVLYLRRGERERVFKAWP